MPTVRSFSALCLAAAAIGATPASAQLLGPSPYLSATESPFNPTDYTAFFLEDFEDLALDTPGLMASGSGMCLAGVGGECFTGGGLTDSVGNGGDPLLGHSLWAGGSITLTFDALVLGSLPIAAGLVWTDGSNPITFEAFDQNGVSLGTLMGSHATAGFTGQTDEDRFYGAINPGGISQLRIGNPGGMEIDHIQYGVGSTMAAVPEPISWALMLLGFGFVGSALRSRKPQRPRVNFTV